MKQLAIWMVCLMSCVPMVHADALSAPMVSEVMGSVFIKHQGKYSRATKGMLLAQGDEVRTAARSKVYLDFPDQSRIKLGVRSRFVVHDWTVSNKDVFTSSVSILKGAFRYTAGILNGWKNRKTTIYTKTAVLGVRGTDFWGRVQSDNTFFLLIEGSVMLSTKKGKPILYDQAGYVVNIQDEISAPQAFPAVKIGPLAAETEM